MTPRIASLLRNVSEGKSLKRIAFSLDIEMSVRGNQPLINPSFHSHSINIILKLRYDTENIINI